MSPDMKFSTLRHIAKEDVIITSVEDMGAEATRDPGMEEGRSPTMEDPTLNSLSSEQKTLLEMMGVHLNATFVNLYFTIPGTAPTPMKEINQIPNRIRKMVLSREIKGSILTFW